MSTILNLHRCLTKNIGDLVCAPTLYFKEFANIHRADLVGWHQSSQPDKLSREEWKRKVAEVDAIIIGGGGLLQNSFFEVSLEHLFKVASPGKPIILWGAGHNNWQINDWRKLKQEISLKGLPFSLVGIRDYGQSWDWVPCASCMMENLDVKHEILHDFAVYAHSATLAKPHLRNKLPAGFPILDNSAPLDEVISFIGAAQTLLTDSYHGAYWATLMGRKVVAFPTSSKFYDLKHAIPLGDPVDWHKLSRLSIAYPEALEECREANRDFYLKVLEVVSSP